MKRARIAVVGLGALLAATWAAGPVAAKDQTLREMMGENFAGLQVILNSLITANYATIPPQVKRIEEHAEALTHNVPKSAAGDRDRFMTYAYNLRTHTKDLGAIIQALIEHDQGKEQLATDELREAAAAHYGGMVTLCVSCHNRFRPKVIH